MICLLSSGPRCYPVTRENKRDTREEETRDREITEIREMIERGRERQREEEEERKRKRERFIRDRDRSFYKIAYQTDCVFFTEKCIFNGFSLMDLMEFLYGLSLLCFFLFLRGEYLRNMEECIWKTVNQIQDTFDFRRF